MTTRAGTSATTRSRGAIEAERRIPQWLRDETPATRESHANLLDRQADQAEAKASRLRSKARALRVYNRRLSMGMTIEDAPNEHAESFYQRPFGPEVSQP